MRLRLGKISKDMDDEYKAEKLRLENIVAETHNASLQAISTRFLEGLGDIITMFRLPLIVLMHAIANSEMLLSGLELLSDRTRDKDFESFSDTDVKNTVEEFKSKLVEISPDMKKVEDRYKRLTTSGGVLWSGIGLEQVLNMHEQHQESYIDLLYSGVVWMWTLFEVTAANLWVAMLNAGFDAIGKDALKRITKNEYKSAVSDKIRGKYIRMDYLAEFDFNIKDNVGSFLKNYFDFDSLSGIKDAYSFVFPRSVIIRDSMNNDTLRNLSEDRNLIVHKAAYIDAKYINITGSTQNIGDKLSVDEEKCAEYQTVITKVVGNILNCANQYLKMGSES